MDKKIFSTTFIASFRKSAHPINELFINRWSPRAMSGQELSDQELMSLFEAARWAPSSYNAQQWRFIYAKRNTPHWQTFFDLLDPFNQSWCTNAAVLVVVVSRTLFAYDNKPSRTHSFDTGAAWMSLALQGSLNGLVVHGMQGFNYEKAQAVLNIPALFSVEAMIAIGHPGKLGDLPADLQKREFPSNRKTVQEIAFEGTFKETAK